MLEAQELQVGLARLETERVLGEQELQVGLGAQAHAEFHAIPEGEGEAAAGGVRAAAQFQRQQL